MEGESAMLTWIRYPTPALSMEGASPIAMSSPREPRASWQHGRGGGESGGRASR
ncbi:hypothetical protein ZEAMMB73_Zm00001d019451 [Zea mays]|uniref:Uncharacterized protein n=1 Tax=Zea mays TaxID=4577 RepID=A0A1D6HXJ3_MAIZE|nr:hypothetical protein ZEAMMB73_Zm00001d019451 [Zea mays]ONM52931.1 hypothetical protein ZEAMMB73_Zm00001d019451 [Zea mays]ONM52934.1 hypothetical protein ZEAMMB73_Zm00001d019451 [Zea mays]ONM52935.1 hypothetical protein ZEAMMB73_Zm00001d019451 [Zea mays]ONM52936.1 hypothetical protein ZEAMMB73_Zm00001d019451 [Zea mays]